LHKFCEKKCKFFANNLSKEICTFLVFLDFAKFFAYLKWHGQGLFKNVYFFIFWTNFFGKQFYYKTGFCNKKFNFCKFAIFLQILKVEHNSFPMMYHLSYLDIKHGIKRGGVKLTPPAYPGFQVPQQG